MQLSIHFLSWYYSDLYSIPALSKEQHLPPESHLAQRSPWVWKAGSSGAWPADPEYLWPRPLPGPVQDDWTEAEGTTWGSCDAPCKQIQLFMRGYSAISGLHREWWLVANELTWMRGRGEEEPHCWCRHSSAQGRSAGERMCFLQGQRSTAGAKPPLAYIAQWANMSEICKVQ